MNTETLIDTLAAKVVPVRRWALQQRLALGIAAGSLIAVLLVAFGLGVRPDLDVAMHGFSFWMKWTYTASLGIGAIAMVAQLARPEAASLKRFWPVAIPFVLLAGISAGEMANVSPGDWLAMWLGQTWRTCPSLVLMLAAPIFVGLLWAFRRLAPTRLRAAGAAAGLAAGAWAATFYCLHCPEVSAIFVLTWYTLGIALATAAGALLGPRLLRW